MSHKICSGNNGKSLQNVELLSVKNSSSWITCLYIALCAIPHQMLRVNHGEGRSESLSTSIPALLRLPPHPISFHEDPSPLHYTRSGAPFDTSSTSMLIASKITISRSFAASRSTTSLSPADLPTSSAKLLTKAGPLILQNVLN